MKSALKIKDLTSLKERSKSSLKFAGPLKILVIEPKGEYYKTVWCAIGLGLSNVMIGAVNMSALLYSLKFGDAHGIICTLAYHFFAAEAILSLNYANGWSTPMRLRHRKFIHILLQICGMAFAIAGTTIILVSKWPPHSAHGIAGAATAVMGFINLLTGPCALLNGRFFKLFHMGFGIPTFIMSSISICLGFFTPNFKKWADITVIIVLICFVVFYTIFIVTTVFIKFLYKL